MDEKQKKALTSIIVSSGLLTKKQTEAVLAKEEVFRARIIKAKGMSIKKAGRDLMFRSLRSSNPSN